MYKFKINICGANHMVVFTNKRIYSNKVAHTCMCACLKARAYVYAYASVLGVK